MPDIADDAQAVETLFQDEAIRRARQPLDRRVLLGQDTGICSDCGDEIPEARLRANPAAVRCIDCQQDAEALRHG